MFSVNSSIERLFSAHSRAEIVLSVFITTQQTSKKSTFMHCGVIP